MSFPDRAQAVCWSAPPFLLFANLASAQTKVAVVNLQKAVFDSAEIKKADAEMQAKFKPRQDEIEQLQQGDRGYRHSSCRPTRQADAAGARPI